MQKNTFSENESRCSYMFGLLLHRKITSKKLGGSLESFNNDKRKVGICPQVLNRRFYQITLYETA